MHAGTRNWAQLQDDMESMLLLMGMNPSRLLEALSLSDLVPLQFCHYLCPLMLTFKTAGTTTKCTDIALSVCHSLSPTKQYLHKTLLALLLLLFCYVPQWLFGATHPLQCTWSIALLFAAEALVATASS